MSDQNALGLYLRDRRMRLDAQALGYPMRRRRTPGLRREEVALRACVSATWYTWLEQGRGGAPSTEVLDRLSQALVLSAAEREHLFLLAQNRPPGVEYQEGLTVSPSLQRVIDSMAFSPALIKTADWQVVAWNAAASAVFVDYAALPVKERNVLRMMFCNEELKRNLLPDWEVVASTLVSNFRADIARTGASEHARTLIDELCTLSESFQKMWDSHDVTHYGEGLKQLHLPGQGLVSLEYSTFAVEGKPGLSMVVFNPVADADQQAVQAIMAKTRS